MVVNEKILETLMHVSKIMQLVLHHLGMLLQTELSSTKVNSQITILEEVLLPVEDETLVVDC